MVDDLGLKDCLLKENFDWLLTLGVDKSMSSHIPP